MINVCKYIARYYLSFYYNYNTARKAYQIKMNRRVYDYYKLIIKLNIKFFYRPDIDSTAAMPGIVPGTLTNVPNI